MVPTCDTVAKCHKYLVKAIDSMKKAQAIKLWKELSNSTSAKEVISAFANKRGYGGKRTLVRYSQAAAGFKEGLPCNVIADKTEWSVDYIDKIHPWWKEAFPSELGPVRQELATRVAPARTEQEAPKEVIAAIVSKISEQVPSQVASGQPGRRRLTLDAPVVDGLREKHGPRKKRHLVKAVNPRMTWCGHSLDGRIHLFWTNKIELCTCWHCRRWYNYAASGLLDSDLQKHGGTA
jgi:hypothetical protein